MSFRIRFGVLSFLLMGLLSCSDSLKVELQISNDIKPGQIALSVFEKMSLAENIQLTLSNHGIGVKKGGDPGSIEVLSIKHDWEKLFNGKNLDGWQVKAQQKDRDKIFWTVEDGAILCNSLGSKDHGYIWLQSEKEFGDFEMRLKFKVSRENLGNSGVQFRSRYDDKAVVEGEGGAPGWLDGPQADIEPGNPWRNGFIYDETRTVKRWIHPSLPDWRIDKETHAPEKVIFYWEDQQTGWNDMTIICNGTNIKTFVNNALVSDFDGAGILDSEEHKKYNVGMSGHIALQLHKNSENKIWFKDIEVRKL